MARKLRAAGREIVMIGHLGHPGKSTARWANLKGESHLVESPFEDVERHGGPLTGTTCVRHQTTLSLDDAAAIIAALKRRFPSIAEPKKADICYATKTGQDAVKFMAPQVDGLLW